MMFLNLNWKMKEFKQAYKIANFKVKNPFFQKKPNQNMKFDILFFYIFCFEKHISFCQKTRDFKRKKRQNV